MWEREKTHTQKQSKTVFCFSILPDITINSWLGVDNQLIVQSAFYSSRWYGWLDMRKTVISQSFSFLSFLFLNLKKKSKKSVLWITGEADLQEAELGLCHTAVDISAFVHNGDCDIRRQRLRGFSCSSCAPAERRVQVGIGSLTHTCTRLQKTPPVTGAADRCEGNSWTNRWSHSRRLGDICDPLPRNQS